MRTWTFHPSSDILGLSRQVYACDCVHDCRQLGVCVCDYVSGCVWLGV